MRILAVEDNKTAKLIYDALAARFNFEVYVVASCDEALAALKSLVFDVIIMDWELGATNGLVCTKYLRELQQSQMRYVPIIAVTAHATDSHRQECLDAGMDDYLSKPFQASDLNQMLMKWNKIAADRR